MENERQTGSKITEAVLVSAIVILTAAMWNYYSWYSVAAPLGTLISFAFLAVMFFLAVPVKAALRDPVFLLAALGAIIAGINLLLIDSGWGAWLTAADLLIMLYLAGKIRLSRAGAAILCAYVGFYFFYWTFDVKGYFKGYNTNYGGLVLITGFVFAVTGIIMMREKLKESEPAGARFLSAFLVFMFIWGYNIIAWYRARCALIGLAVFAVLLLIPMKIWKNRLFYGLLTAAATAGAIAVSLVYVWLGRFADRLDIRIFYKDIISGRDAIWADLWSAFLKMPVTGIGSSYIIKVDWMNGMFEVHNGLLDILIVHGLFVFAVTLFVMIRSLMPLRECAGENITAKAAVAATFAILAASFMENFFIVPPFLLCTLALIAIARSV
ncbi:MAG: O-antigen ligase family protein [Lachnospiraceae bacterium]|nr:O-antigen ligase family protein [Lachnospiraceae bacterium]